mgnify:CR=1 FL=1
MSPWTLLLESLHSAMIDELTERHPKPKPELGLPMRKTRIELPDPSLIQTLFISVDLGGTRGILMLASQPEFMKAIQLSSQDFWNAIFKRTGSEFARRNITPRFSPPESIEGPLTVQVRGQGPLRVVWIPFKIPAGACYLGLAV